jgi:hypothetical protein
MGSPQKMENDKYRLKLLVIVCKNNKNNKIAQKIAQKSYINKLFLLY